MERLLPKMGAPALFNKEFMDNLAVQPLLPPKSAFPEPKFTRARIDQNGRRMPQTIAHRGYKAMWPENTMRAFKAAVEVGVHALETDVHLTKDRVVVLSHDKTLQRCFGVEKKLLDCEWKYIQELRTSKEPHEPMPRLEDLLKYLAQPKLSNIWLLLDIKIDNDADDIMKLMSEALARVKPAKGTRWKDRIVLGCWGAKFIPLANQYFPDFPVTNIGFSISYSRQFFAVPNVSFNMLQVSLVSPAGRKFIRDAKSKERPVYAWTANEERMMDWCIRRTLDGVITDDPKKFLEVCEKFDEKVVPTRMPLKMLLNFIRINFLAWIFGILFWWKHGYPLNKRFLDSP